MKTSKLFLLAMILHGFSCSSLVDVIMDVELETLHLSEGSLSYMDFYENTDKIILRKVSKHEPDASKMSVTIKATTSSDTDINYSDLWVFEKQGVTERHYKSQSTGRNGVYTYGDYETRKITYHDNHGHKLKIWLTMHQQPSFGNSEWDRSTENFIITYNDPCTDTYIDYRTIYYRNKPSIERDETIIVAAMQVGSITYHDVMKLKVVEKSSHYALYVTKDEGLIRIDALDNNETWEVVGE